MKLKNFVSGSWQEGSGEGTPLHNPVNGSVLAHAGSDGLDLGAALDYARSNGSKALQKMTYAERAGLLEAAVEVLSANKENYYKIALENSGNTPIDAMIDVDGGIGTLKYYSALGKSLGDTQYLTEAGLERLAKDKAFQACHILTPIKGVAIHINAFNFPSWGLWEKASVALLSGVAVFAKPATATSILTNQMVQDIIAADIFPSGALSVICGGGHDLMDHVQSNDVVLFTGSADTAEKLRSNANVIRSGVRFNVEADSVNMSVLGPDVEVDSPLFAGFIKEVHKEMTTKAGQKCTAIRRILVPQSRIDEVAEALCQRLAKTTTGDPRIEGVRMGPVVSNSQLQAAIEGIETLKQEAKVIFGGRNDFEAQGDNSAQGYFVEPTLLRCDSPDSATRIHDTEVFGPVATLMPYGSEDNLWNLAARGGGSLAGSVFSADQNFASRAIIQLAPCHGRLLVVDDAVMESQTGHGIVMPQCVHGGPGRAGAGEELGGLRGLRLYHQRSAVQGNAEWLEALQSKAATIA